MAFTVTVTDCNGGGALNGATLCNGRCYSSLSNGRYEFPDCAALKACAGESGATLIKTSQPSGGCDMAYSGGTVTFDFSCFGIESGNTITFSNRGSSSCYDISPSSYTPDFCARGPFPIIQVTPKANAPVTCKPLLTTTEEIRASIGTNVIASVDFTRCGSDSPQPTGSTILTVNIRYNDSYNEPFGSRYLSVQVSTGNTNYLSGEIINWTTNWYQSNTNTKNFSTSGTCSINVGYYLYIGFCSGPCSQIDENNPFVEATLFDGDSEIQMDKYFQSGYIFGPFSLGQSTTLSLNVTGYPSRI